jgi:hypothetical protein
LWKIFYKFPSFTESFYFLNINKIIMFRLNSRFILCIVALLLALALPATVMAAGRAIESYGTGAVVTDTPAGIFGPDDAPFIQQIAVNSRYEIWLPFQGTGLMYASPGPGVGTTGSFRHEIKEGKSSALWILRSWRPEPLPCR